ncbi:MAG: hypothetical protein GY796_09090 [Chloroflexi bacterium]|nr:hypothetical protein [Chloroflexota bacterium]
MNSWQLLILTLIFGLLFWQGFYLIARDAGRVMLWLAGLASLALATAVALNMLNQYAFSIQLALRLLRIEQFLIVLTMLLGLAVVVTLAPGYDAWAHRFQNQKWPMGLAWLSLIGFSLVIGSVVISGMIVPGVEQMILLGASLFLLGTAVSMIHASDQGEVWFPHFFRSFDYSFFTALLFGGQVALIMIFATGVTFPMLLLLLGTIAAAILVQVFSDSVQTAVDQIAFFNFPNIRRQRSDSRAESDATQRLDSSLNLMQMDEKTFTQHTRRALSHMGNLPKLAANPLTNLPLVNVRLQMNGRHNSTLLRATELKIILSESIDRLKPPDEGDFGTTNAWRFYNALYFPYVKGLRPYSRRAYYAENGEEETAVKEALDWFRSQVPERTLYNWQNAAAQLIARDLRERSQHIT